MVKNLQINLMCPECLVYTNFKIVFKTHRHFLECQQCKSQYPTNISFDREQAMKSSNFKRIQALRSKYLTLEGSYFAFNKAGLEILKKYIKNIYMKWWHSMDGFAVMAMCVPCEPDKRPPKEFWSCDFLIFKAPAKPYTREEEYSNRWNSIVDERGYKSSEEICNYATKVYFAETESEVHFIVRGLCFLK